MIDHTPERKTRADKNVAEAGGELVDVAGERGDSLAGGLIAMTLTAGVVIGGYAVARQVVKELRKRRQTA